MGGNYNPLIVKIIKKKIRDVKDLSNYRKKSDGGKQCFSLE